MCRDCGGVGRLPNSDRHRQATASATGRRGRAARLVAAWMLSEGDILADRTTIIAIIRDTLTRSVHYTTDAGERVTQDGQALVVVIHRSIADATNPPVHRRPRHHIPRRSRKPR